MVLICAYLVKFCQSDFKLLLRVRLCARSALAERDLKSQTFRYTA